MTMQKVTLEVPANWLGNVPEFYCWWALTRLGINFTYQESYAGGRLEKGGIVADFYLPDHNIAIQIRSIYWHGGVERRAIDEIQRIMLEGMGIVVVFIDEEFIMADPIFYVKEALKGVSHTVLT